MKTSAGGLSALVSIRVTVNRSDRRARRSGAGSIDRLSSRRRRLQEEEEEEEEEERSREVRLKTSRKVR